MLRPPWKHDLGSLFAPKPASLVDEFDNRPVLTIDISHFGSSLVSFLNEPSSSRSNATNERETDHYGTAQSVPDAHIPAVVPDYLLLEPDVVVRDFGRNRINFSRPLRTPIRSSVPVPISSTPLQEEPAEAPVIVTVAETSPEEDVETAHCSVCFEDRPTTSFPSSNITTECTHAPSTCIPCLQQSIKHSHQNNMWDAIYCPECPVKFSYQDVQKWADPETFAHYDHLALREIMSANVNFMWCLQCPSGQIHVSGDAQPIMQCQACNSRACFTHKVPWHNGYTCKGYDKLLKSTRATTFSSLTERTPFLNLARVSRSRLSLFQRPSGQPSKRIEKGDEYVIDGCAMTALDVERLRHEKEVMEAVTRRNQEEENSKKTIRKVCKICPGKGCNWPIQKNDGCAHMTCNSAGDVEGGGSIATIAGGSKLSLAPISPLTTSIAPRIKCFHEFCYECLNPYDKILKYGNAYHASECKFHTRNIRDTRGWRIWRWWPW